MVERRCAGGERRPPAISRPATVHCSAGDAGLGGDNAEAVHVALAVGPLEGGEAVNVIDRQGRVERVGCGPCVALFGRDQDDTLAARAP